MTTTPLPKPSIFDRLMSAVSAAASDILASSSGFGHNDFEVDDDGELIPHRTTITHQPNNKLESDEQFIRRLKQTGQWQRGDAVQIVYNNRKIQLVKITRNPPKASVQDGIIVSS